jgi:GDPmannose 4,6-dehydratase
VKTALITGVSGQDGQYLSELLLAKGYRVIGTSRSPGFGATSAADPAERTLELRTLDLLRPDHVNELVRELRPDEIYHLAGQSSVGQSFADPAGTFHSLATSTLNVLEATRQSELAARIFVASSGEIFGDTGAGSASETSPFRPQSPYAAAKVAATELARTHRLAFGSFACVGYLFNHESPRRPERFVTRKIVRGACEIALGRRDHLELGELSVVRDFGWAPEYVEVMWRILARDTPDDFVVATGSAHPLSEFVELVFSTLGLKATDHVRRNSAFLRRSEIPVLRGDPSRAERLLGWRATVPLAEIARRMIEVEKARLG